MACSPPDLVQGDDCTVELLPTIGVQGSCAGGVGVPKPVLLPNTEEIPPNEGLPPKVDDNTGVGDVLNSGPATNGVCFIWFIVGFGGAVLNMAALTGVTFSENGLAAVAEFVAGLPWFRINLLEFIWRWENRHEKFKYM